MLFNPYQGSFLSLGYLPESEHNNVTEFAYYDVRGK